MDQNKISVSTVVHAPIEKVWEYWNEPEHIMKWAFASDDWEAPAAENDLRAGGSFTTTMAAKDGSAKFDFEGTYSVVREHELIEYAMPDGRQVSIKFEVVADGVRIVETFDPESENSLEMQAEGWQAIMDNFKKHVEQAK